MVNPWAVPLQKPYPRVWIPGVISKETIIWAAQQRYPYIALNTSIEQTKKIWELYAGTEAQSVTVIKGDEWLEHPGSVGRPIVGEMRMNCKKLINRYLLLLK